MPTRFFVETELGFFVSDVDEVLPTIGFFLCDDDQSWDGGFGIARSWQRVKASEVPKEVKSRLGWILRE